MRKCYICKSSELNKIPYEITEPGKVHMCMNCGVLSTYPQMNEKEIEQFYNDSFDGDPGAENITEDALKRLEQTTFETSINEINKYVVPYIKPYINLKNIKWLEIRYRTGALLKILHENNIEVFGVDPFQNNKKSVIRNYPKLLKNVKVENVYNLLNPFIDKKFDVISSISIHSLAHVPDPLQYLNRIYNMLNPNGFAIFDEKDIEHVSEDAATLPLEHPNPLGHYHHFTFRSLKNLIEMTNFEIQFMDYYERKSDLKHIIVILKKVEKKELNKSLFNKLIGMHR